MSTYDLLVDGDMTIEGRMPWSSNATFLVTISAPSETVADGEDEGDPSDAANSVKGIYKPHKGERPLWDFPNGLYRREVAAYELDAFLGWGVIPRTVKRDGTFGIGSVQTFIDADFEQHYFTMMESRPELLDQLHTLAVFDILANNADRKGGHILVGATGQTDATSDGNDRTDGPHGIDRIWGIDNGLCFHDEPKLRTVMWDFAGDMIPKRLKPDIERLASLTEDTDPFGDLLSDDECGALVARAKKLLRKPTFPHPTSNYAYPWPMV